MSQITENKVVAAPVPMTPLQEFWHYFKRNKGAVVGLVYVAIMIIIAVFANFLAPYNPADQFRDVLLAPPAWQDGGSFAHLLGTDDVGRDILSRLMYGARLSLLVGCLVVVLSLILGVVLGLIAFASIIFGNLMALSQTNIKRLLGYSSISHLGYLLVALIALQSGEMSMEAVGVYLAGYLFSSLGAFGVVSLMSSPYRGPDADSLYSYRGLFWHRPILSAVMTVMMLSLAGIPMTLGFIGKFYVLAVGVHAHLWWLVAAVVIGSAIGLYYYLRVAVSLYLSAPDKLNRDAPSNWQYSAGGIVVLISALLVLVLGVWPQPLISIVQLATPLM